MADLNISSGGFIVYNTVETNVPRLVKTLNSGVFDNANHNLWHASPKSFIGQSVSSVVQHHRHNAGTAVKVYFVVADRQDWDREGVLAISLDEEGYIDALRMRAGAAGDALPSFDIGNTDWYADRGARYHGNFYPVSRFAVYIADDTLLDAKKLELFLINLNAGLELRKQHSPPTCRLAPRERTAKDLETIIKDHAELAKEEGFDPSYFIVADDADWMDYGVMVVRIAGDGAADTPRKPIDVASEVLTWIHQGLYSWQEAKDWDEEQQEMEE